MPPPPSPPDPSPPPARADGYADLHPSVASVLARLERTEPVVALEAAAALEWLLGDAGLEQLHQAALQQFCWYELPFKWVGPMEAKLGIVDSLGRVLELAGLGRYREVCRSATTAAVLRAWADEPSAGFDAFHRAHLASGVVPPDLADLAWGDLMGEAEIGAFWSTAKVLELAVASGDLVPGSRGWRARQVELASSHVSAPRPDRFGETLLETVMAERIGAFVVDGPSNARRQLLDAVHNQLLAPMPAPRRAGQALRPLKALIELASTGSGIRLTATGHLPAATVTAVARTARWPVPSVRPRAAQVPAVVALAAVAESAGLVARRGGRLVATRRARQADGDVEALWSAAAAGLGAASGLGGVVGESVDALLLAGGEVEGDELVGITLVVVTEAGFDRGVPGRPMPLAELSGVIDDELARRLALGAVAGRGGVPRRPLRLTATGRHLVRAALRARAVRPLRPRR